MLKSELIQRMAGKMMNLSEQTVEQAVNRILTRMSQALVEGQRIEIRDFGAFTVRKMPERCAHNPKTGNKVTVVSKSKVHFKPGLGLKCRIVRFVSQEHTLKISSYNS